MLYYNIDMIYKWNLCRLCKEMSVCEQTSQVYRLVLFLEVFMNT